VAHTTSRSVRLRPDHAERVRLVAERHGRSESEVVAEALDRFLPAADDDATLARWLQYFEKVKRRAAALPSGPDRPRGWTRDELHERGRGH